MTNTISPIASTPFTGIGTQTYTVPTTGTYTLGAQVTIPWLTSDQPAYGTPAANVSTVVTVADSGGSLNNTYFEFHLAGDTKFLSGGTFYNFIYVWYNINSAGTDPAPSGGFGIEVDAATNALNTTIATDTQAAIAAAAGLPAYVKATVSGHTVTLANQQLGACTAIADTGTTGFTLATPTVGAYGGTSGLNVLLKHGSTILQQLANPAPTQATLSGQQTVACTAGDTLTVVVASTAAADNAPNAIKGVINVFQGPL